MAKLTSQYQNDRYNHRLDSHSFPPFLPSTLAFRTRRYSRFGAMCNKQYSFQAKPHCDLLITDAQPLAAAQPYDESDMAAGQQEYPVS
jgi:hypothetical protein